MCGERLAHGEARPPLNGGLKVFNPEVPVEGVHGHLHVDAGRDVRAPAHENDRLHGLQPNAMVRHPLLNGRT